MLLLDIIFISYQEPNADENWQHLLERFPYAKRLHGVKGIHQAHRQAARISATDKFWVVDGDSQVEEDFNFEPPHVDVEDFWADAVYVYKSRNPVNNLVYGYGGIKLLPKEHTLNMDLTTTDMTTSIAKYFLPQDVVASVTKFNSDPFNTWKSAFRECAKLSSKVINNQDNAETENRLDVWCTAGEEQEYGEWCIKGALAGRDYGTKHKDNPAALKLVNDFDWLKNIYIESVK